MTERYSRATEGRRLRHGSKFRPRRESYCHTPFMHKPMPFILTTEEGKFIVNEEVEKILPQAVKPISSIAIAGKDRTGKSYIMNRFFEENAGFDLGSTVQSKTKGIWIWARPHPLDPRRTLVLLDTEGLLDVEKGDETHDMKILSLAVLLSKCFVYNAVGTLDNRIIEELNLVSGLTQHVQINGAKDYTTQFSRYFPSFFLLLRDFYLEKKIDGRPCTSNEYFEHALSPKPGTSKKVADYNLTREGIRKYFAERTCFTLCSPVQQQAKLKVLERLPEKDIDPTFLAEAKAATNAILRKAEPMLINGSPINGTGFLHLAKCYVKSMNEGAVPCISNAVDLLKTHECEKFLKLAIEKFDRLMREKLKGKLPVESDILLEYTTEARGEAVACYQQGALFDQDGQYKKKLLCRVEQCYQQYVTENNVASKKKCEEILQSCFSVITVKLKHGQYVGRKGGYSLYVTDKAAVMKKYTCTPGKGPLAEKCLQLFLESKKTEEIVIRRGEKVFIDKNKEIMKAREERRRQQLRAKEAKAKEEQVMWKKVQQEIMHKEMIQKMDHSFKLKQKMLLEAEEDRKRRDAEFLEEVKAVVSGNIMNVRVIEIRRVFLGNLTSDMAYRRVLIFHESQCPVCRRNHARDGCVIQ